MRVNFILATLQNGGMGKNNTLPWKLVEDLKFFKKTTLEHPIVMGYKTFLSLGSKPLSRRHNYIITTDISSRKGNVDKYGYLTVIDTFENILAELKNYPDIFVIGGSKTFQLFEPYVNRVYHTVVIDEELNKIECDVFYEPKKYLPILDEEILRLEDKFYIAKYNIDI